MSSQTLRFAVVVHAEITDPVAVSATDVATIADDSAGTVDPYIPPAEETLHSAVMRAVATAIANMPGAKFRSAGIVAYPWDETTGQTE
jgi:hypothetical protein